MIIKNNFNLNKNNFHKKDYLEEERLGLKKSIDKLDSRYKNGEIDIEKFKKVANNYAIQQKNLNQRINDKH